MKRQNNLLTRKFFVVLISIFFLVLFTFLIFDGYLNLERDKEIYIINAKDMISDRVNSLLFEMNILPQDIGNEVLFISELSSMDNLLNPVGDSEENAIKDLEEDFLNFLKGSQANYQLKYVDEKGREIVKAEFNGSDCYIVPEGKLLNMNNDYYFKQTMKLRKEEIYFSKQDLNVVNGLIENIGTEDNPSYVPIIRIATPVYNSSGINRGIVMLSIYVDYFLDDIRLAQRSGDSLFLITREGYYLANPDRQKEFSYSLEKESNFYNDYPSVPRNYLLDVNKRTFEDDNFVFSFKHIYSIPKGAKIYGVDDGYSWILVTVSDKAQMEKMMGNLENNYVYFLLFSGVIIITIVGLIFLFSSIHMHHVKAKRK
jgi:methyl-accepting chemotaxis protein